MTHMSCCIRNTCWQQRLLSFCNPLLCLQGSAEFFLAELKSGIDKMQGHRGFGLKKSHLLQQAFTQHYKTNRKAKPQLKGPVEQCFFSMYPALYTGSMRTQMPPHAYADCKGCLRPRFLVLGAYAGASAGFFVGWPC